MEYLPLAAALEGWGERLRLVLRRGPVRRDAIAQVESGARERREPRLTSQGPEFVDRLQLVRRVE